MILVSILVDRPIVGQTRHGAPGAAHPVSGDGRVPPIRLEPKLPVGKAKAAEKVRLLEWGLQVEPPLFFQSCKIAVARSPQRPINDLAWRHRECRMFRADASSECRDHLVIRAAVLGRVDSLGGELQMLMASGGV